MSDTIFVIIKFLLANILCHSEFFYNLHLSIFLYHITHFMILPPDLFCVSVFKYNWYDTEKISFLSTQTPHISLLPNMDTIIKNQSALAEKLSGVLQSGYCSCLMG